LPNLVIDLRRAIAEVATIVVGVLIALGVNNWNENRIGRNLESQYLGRLREAASSNTETAELIVRLANDKLEALGALERVLQQPSDSRSTSEVIAAVRSGSLNLGWTIPVFDSVVFEEMRSTGRLGLIRQVELREKVINYYLQIFGQIERMNDRRTDFAPYIYRLIPPEVLRGESDVNSLADGRMAAVVDTEGFRELITAERNYASFIVARMADLLPLTQEVEESLRAAVN